jgi:hypothetical protein
LKLSQQHQWEKAHCKARLIALDIRVWQKDARERSAFQQLGGRGLKGRGWSVIA